MKATAPAPARAVPVQPAVRLPDALFEAVVGCDSLRVERSGNAEKRTSGRIRLPARLQVIPMAQHVVGKPVNAQVRDLSPDGIGVLLPNRMSIGDHLLVRLQAKEMMTWVLCHVVRAERVAEGLFVVGASFMRILDNPGKA